MIENQCGLRRHEWQPEPADILLVHTKRSVWASIVRLGTRCYWNHAAMVCRGPGRQDHKEALLVDAKTDGAIVIRPAADYLDHPDKYVVGVKRLNGAWRSGRPPVRDLRGDICKLAVNEVDVNLGPPLIARIDKCLRQLTVIFRFVRRRIVHISRPPALPWNVRPADLKAFTCAGFVQWCYYKAAQETLEDPEDAALSDYVFNPRAGERITPFELLTTTPADLAVCDRLSWEYGGDGSCCPERTSGYTA